MQNKTPQEIIADAEAYRDKMVEVYGENSHDALDANLYLTQLNEIYEV